MPLVITTRESTREERQAMGLLTTMRARNELGLGPHGGRTLRLDGMFGVLALVAGMWFVASRTVMLGVLFAMAVIGAVMAAIGQRRYRRLIEQDFDDEFGRQREVTEVRFASDRILVVSGDRDDGEVWWLFRTDDGQWLFLANRQWQGLQPSSPRWGRDVTLVLDSRRAVLSFASGGPPVAVERRDLQPPSYEPTSITLFWSPPGDQDLRSLVLGADPIPRMRTFA